MNGYRRATNQRKDSKVVFLDAARTKKVKEDSVVRVYDHDGKSYTEGRILCLLPEYFTVCINEETLTGLICYRHNWEDVEVIEPIPIRKMFSIYGKEGCSVCNKLIMVMDMIGKEYEYKLLGVDYTEEDFETKFPGKNMFPQVELDGQYIGDCKKTINYLKEHRVI
tara:strand:+ start:2260 stop:2757 length:498 start_codon:yes stop_codon:yes gene_type:complete